MFSNESFLLSLVYPIEKIQTGLGIENLKLSDILKARSLTISPSIALYGEINFVGNVASLWEVD